ncbi:type II secretion system F family protein [Acinetobacter sp. B5B]|uniref:type II secretion system F family protein n=1 Tax=Acinetobacter baretiae TaxID=2605383 RepID=UPI0018C318BD|nr:type II secretion system F family protein [Acinetobacter baretiae]MBF7683649.1 type II secretion system F family protein [Acinetobacter baretiae]
MNDYFIYLSFIGIALVLSYITWQIFIFISSVPDEQRDYLDKPPFIFHILWFLIKPISFYITPFISKKNSERIEKKLIFAGKDFIFKVKDIIASKIVFSLTLLFISILLLEACELDLTYSIAFSIYGFIYPELWLRSEKLKRERIILREIPFFLDIIVLCVEAGLTFINAVDQAVNKSNQTPTRQEFSRLLADVKKGVPRSDALRKMSSRVEHASMQNLTSAIIQAESMGMNLGPILRGQAEQRRVERFLRAEKLALEAPVKMLFPLVAFIFPCTFIVIGFPLYVMMKDAFQ